MRARSYGTGLAGYRSCCAPCFSLPRGEPLSTARAAPAIDAAKSVVVIQEMAPLAVRVRRWATQQPLCRRIPRVIADCPPPNMVRVAPIWIVATMTRQHLRLRPLPLRKHFSNAWRDFHFSVDPNAASLTICASPPRPALGFATPVHLRPEAIQEVAADPYAKLRRFRRSGAHPSRGHHSFPEWRRLPLPSTGWPSRSSAANVRTNSIL